MTDLPSPDKHEKQSLLEEGSLPQSEPRQPPALRERLVRHIFPCLLLLLSASILFRKIFVCHHHYAPGQHLQPVAEDESWPLTRQNSTKVALEAHIMSKCPDAKYCLEKLVVPTMAQVSDKIDFTLSYIGSVDPHSDEVKCKHGPAECLGNLIQLCAANVYPDPLIYLGFANCMTMQYQRIPDRDLVEGCALEHGIDFQTLNDCISQEGDGIELLRRSIERSQQKKVSTSCTVRLEDEVYCVRDGGEWKDCPNGSDVSDLVAEIEILYFVKNNLVR